MRQHHLLSFLFPLALALQQPSVRFRALVLETVLNPVFCSLFRVAPSNPCSPRTGVSDPQYMTWKHKDTYKGGWGLVGNVLRLEMRVRIDWDIQGTRTRTQACRDWAHSLPGIHPFSLQQPSVLLILQQEQTIQSFTRLLVRGMFFNSAILALNTNSWCTSFFGGEAGSSSTLCCHLHDHVTSACCCFAHAQFSREIYISPTCLISLLVPQTANPLGTYFSLPLFKTENSLVGWIGYL